jgi:hypothetical protein
MSCHEFAGGSIQARDPRPRELSADPNNIYRSELASNQYWTELASDSKIYLLPELDTEEWIPELPTGCDPVAPQIQETCGEPPMANANPDHGSVYGTDSKALEDSGLHDASMNTMANACREITFLNHRDVETSSSGQTTHPRIDIFASRVPRESFLTTQGVYPVPSLSIEESPHTVFTPHVSPVTPSQDFACYMTMQPSDISPIEDRAFSEQFYLHSGAQFSHDSNGGYQAQERRDFPQPGSLAGVPAGESPPYDGGTMLGSNPRGAQLYPNCSFTSHAGDHTAQCHRRLANKPLVSRRSAVASEASSSGALSRDMRYDCHETHREWYQALSENSAEFEKDVLHRPPYIQNTLKVLSEFNRADSSQHRSDSHPTNDRESENSASSALYPEKTCHVCGRAVFTGR